ncbi:putative histidinol-phosphatase [Clostridia bacterium]|nr:putative histidinol-phosphatase [Clostridia bacterium]
MVFDTHTHSKLSTDSKMNAEDGIRAARNKGIGIIFTEHYDADCPHPFPEFRVDGAAYLKAYEKYRAADVLLGIEIGLSMDFLQENKDAAARDFDVVIGSVHSVRGVDIYTDLNGGAKSINAGEYLTYMKELLNQDIFFDVLGHIDYPQRYVENPEEYDYLKNSDIYDEILHICVKKHIVPEINSKRLGDDKAFRQLAPIYAKYREFGGLFVTIGSDAHNPKNIGLNFKEAFDMARTFGLSPVYFEKRKSCTID